ncbi:DNA-methyltransferase [Enterococcus alishanensis]
MIGMKKIPDESIDMILCDLPYGTTNCSWDVIIPFKPLWEQYMRIIKDNGAIVLTGTEPFSSMLRMSNLDIYKYDWIWDKIKGTGFLNANRQPMRNHENISVFYKKQCTYNPQKTIGHERKTSKRTVKHQSELYGFVNVDNAYDSTERFPRSVQVFSMDTQKEALHPTQKPLALFEYLIKTYTNEGDLVLDNCMGSGTTAVACLNTERRYIGYELNKAYYETSLTRIKNNNIQMNLFG